MTRGDGGYSSGDRITINKVRFHSKMFAFCIVDKARIVTKVALFFFLSFFFFRFFSSSGLLCTERKCGIEMQMNN